MSRSYRISQPITNLRTLRQERQILRRHILENDKALKETINDLPLVALLHSAQKLGSGLLNHQLGKWAGSLISAGAFTGKKAFFPALLKGTAAFAGMKMARYFIQKWKKSKHPEADFWEDEATGNGPDLAGDA